VNTGGVALIGPLAPLRGGIAAHNERLLEAMRRDGLDVTAVSYSRLYPRIGFPGTSQFHASAVPHVSGEEPAASATAWLDTLDPRSWQHVAALLERLRPARVVAQWWHPVAAPALGRILAACPRATVTLVCHNLLPHERFPFSRALAAATLRRAGLVVCHSRTVADQVRGLLPAARVETVPLPALIEVGSPAMIAALRQDGCREWAQARYAVPAGAPLVLMAGHVRSYKGAQVLLEAWTRRPAGSGCLLLVGECYLRGAARRRFLAQVEADPSIVFVDRYVDDSELVRLLSICQALVLPYRNASQSGMLALATALNVRCVVSDAGSLAEQAPGAQVVPSGDAGALGRAIEEILSDAREAGRCGDQRSMPAQAVAEEPANFLRQWSRVVEVVSENLRP